MTLQLTPLSGAVGAEVHGVTLDDTLSDEAVRELRAAFVAHQVLVFRDQDWTVEQQMAFGRRFGELDTHPFVDGQPGRPEVLDIVTEPDDVVNFGGGWHTDVTFLERPDLGSILYAIEVPPYGGDTLFASMRAAWDALSPTMQGMLDGLTATHSAAKQYAPGGQSTYSKAMSTKNSDAATAEVRHPVVATHPEDGARSIYVNPAFTSRINGLRRNESDALLSMLYDHCTKAHFTCRVRWQPGTVTMWDNRSVQHWALHDYAGHRRHMRRITIAS